MQPAAFDLDLYRGDTARMQLTLWAAGHTPVDLTGVAVKSEIRDRPAGTTLISLHCTITLPNIIEVFLSRANSEKLPQAGVWDLQLVYPNGDVFTPIAGQVKVTMDVTDSTQPYVEHFG